MKFCQDHWDELKDEVKKHGLWHLVPRTGAEAAERARSGGFDPLLASHNVMIQTMMNAFGPEIMTLGDKCPVCYVIKECECDHGDQCGWLSLISSTVEGAVRIAPMFEKKSQESLS